MIGNPQPVVERRVVVERERPVVRERVIVEHHPVVRERVVIIEKHPHKKYKKVRRDWHDRDWDDRDRYRHGHHDHYDERVVVIRR
ncbi:hypothetical protein D3C72_2410530 [compost metagenome]